MHKNVATKVSRGRKKSIAAINKAINILEPRFEIIVHKLVWRATDCGHKIQYKWFGPLYIEQVYTHLIYSASKFNGTDQQHVHGTRLIRYSPKLEASEVPKEIVDFADHTAAKFKPLQAFSISPRMPTKQLLCVSAGMGIKINDTEHSTMRSTCTKTF